MSTLTAVETLNQSLTHLADEVGDLKEQQAALAERLNQQYQRQLSNNTAARSIAPQVINASPVSEPTNPDPARHGMSVVGNYMVVGLDHLIQSINDILTTPIGARVMRREYGSDLPDLIDQAMNSRGKARLYAATAGAIARWEPRVALKSIQLDASALITGRLKMTLTWILRPAYRWMLAWDQPTEHQQVVAL